MISNRVYRTNQLLCIILLQVLLSPIGTLAYFADSVSSPRHTFSPSCDNCEIATSKYPASVASNTYEPAKRILPPPFLNAQDWLGWSVAAFGNDILVGDPHETVGSVESGAAYLFDGSTGALIRVFQEPAPAAGDGFGSSVATVGINTVVIGAPRNGGDGAAVGAGTAYLFAGDTGTLLLTIQNPSPAIGDLFGWSVAGVGDNALVGSPHAGTNNAGRSYLFNGTSGSLIETLQDPAPTAAEDFGWSVAALGSNMVIGAPFADGRAGYSYVFDAAGTLLLSLHMSTTSSLFGWAVSSFGGKIVVGAPYDNTGGSTTGRAYVFDGTTGTLLATLTNPATQVDVFGSSVASIGSNLIVGASSNNGLSGATYLFDNSGALLRTLRKPAPAAGDEFGYSVAGLNDKIIVGAPFDSGVAHYAGAAYLFDTTGTLLLTLQKPQPSIGDEFGSSVAPVGKNILVGAPGNYSNDPIDSGAAYMFDGTTGNLIRTFLNPTPAKNDMFGLSVAALGTNVIISAPGDSTKGTASGAVYIFDAATGTLLNTLFSPGTLPAKDTFGFSVAVFGNYIVVGAPSGGAADPPFATGVAYLFDASGAYKRTLQRPGASASDLFGYSVASVGNSILVGAPLASNEFGVADLFDTAGNFIREFISPNPTVDDDFGWSVAALGNNVLVGAPRDSTGAVNAGAAYLFDGTTGSLVETFEKPTPMSGDGFGTSIAVVGSNVLVGVPGDGTGATNAGAVYLFEGTSGTLLYSLQSPTPTTKDAFGYSVASVGKNIFIGAWGDDSLATDAGAAYFFVVTPFDYSLSNSGDVDLEQGSSGSTTVTATLGSGTAQSVNLSCVTSTLPTGASCALNPSSVTPTGSSVLTVSTTSSTPTGSFQVEVTGNPVGATTAPTTFNLTVTRPQNDADCGGDAGNTFDSACSVSPNTPYSGQIIGGQDSQDWYQFYASSGQLIKITITPDSFGIDLYKPNGDWATGPLQICYCISFAADQSGMWRLKVSQYSIGSYSFEIDLASSFDYALSNSGDITVQRGSSGSNSITVTLTSGTAQAVTLQCLASTLPNGDSCSFDPASVTPSSGGATSVLTVHTVSSSPTGSFQVQVGGSPAGATTTSTTFTLNVAPPPAFDYSLTNNGPVTIQSGNSGTVTITATLTSGTAQPVTLSCAASLPSGVICISFTDSSVTPTQSSDLVISVAPGTGAGNVTFQVNGTPVGTTTTPTTVYVVITAPPAPSGASNLILGLDPTTFYEMVGAVLLVLIVSTAVVYRASKQRRDDS